MIYDYALLAKVNAAANKEEYKEDIGPDDWTPFLPKHGSDCDSYSTRKMQDLHDAGWPLEDLRLATCWTETREYHCVLLVELDGQAWVTDNRQAYPTRYQDLSYEWHKVQIPATQRWHYAQDFIDGRKRE